MSNKNKWVKRYKKSARKYTRKLRAKRRNEKRCIWRRRIKAVKYAKKHGARKAAERFKVSVRTIYRWLKRYRENGPDGLRDRSKRPKNPRRISPEIIKKVIELRLTYGIGCEKIALELGISPSTVNKILKKAGLNKSRKKKPVRIKHYERKHANSLWQLDFSQIYKDLWILLVIDDHSRFIVGFKLMKTPNVNETLDLLQECFGKYGVPKQILTDHGTQFYAVRGGVSTFTMFCIEHYIKHILASVKHPQTCGKVERKLGILKEVLERYGVPEKRLDDREIEKIIDDYVEYHNYSRLHFTYQYWIFGKIQIRKKIAFLPYLRFVTHRPFCTEVI